MNKRQFFLGMVLASIVGALVAISTVSYVQNNQPAKTAPTSTFQEKQNVYLSNFLKDTAFTVPAGLNFVYAAEKATPGVVHIRSEYENGGQASRSPFEDAFRDFFGDSPRNNPREPQPARSSGSGVIISQDGYIATNNHVVESADKISVTLNDNRRYEAQIIGTDPTTDLALLKIDADNLDYVEFGNSDDVRIGEWVLAVGNPFDLNSTVTAGIVSAKARNINILRRSGNDLSIESFIQTDAAVNPGNSGGALVNLKGELIGINTAIATPTGTYAGYSFAVPVSLVEKVMDDLLEFGVVQRALLGIRIIDVSAELAEDRDFDELTGVYISDVGPGSSAEDAGLESGDIIVAINDGEVKNVAELQESIALNRPGDNVKVTYVRDGRRETTNAVLKGASGTTDVVVRTASLEIEGATFENVEEDEARELRIDGGAKIADLGSGKWKSAGIKKGFIITSIDKQEIESVEDLQQTIDRKRGGILIEGVYPNGETAYYGMGW